MYRSLLKLGNVSAIKCSLKRKRFESCKIHISSSVLHNEIGLKVTECIYHQVKASGLKLGNVYCPIDTIGKVCIKVGGGGCCRRFKQTSHMFQPRLSFTYHTSLHLSTHRSYTCENILTSCSAKFDSISQMGELSITFWEYPPPPAMMKVVPMLIQENELFGMGDRLCTCHLRGSPGRDPCSLVLFKNLLVFPCSRCYSELVPCFTTVRTSPTTSP